MVFPFDVEYSEVADKDSSLSMNETIRFCKIFSVHHMIDSGVVHEDVIPHYNPLMRVHSINNPYNSTITSSFKCEDIRFALNLKGNILSINFDGVILLIKTSASKHFIKFPESLPVTVFDFLFLTAAMGDICRYIMTADGSLWLNDGKKCTIVIDKFDACEFSYDKAKALYMYKDKIICTYLPEGKAEAATMVAHAIEWNLNEDNVMKQSASIVPRYQFDMFKILSVMSGIEFPFGILDLIIDYMIEDPYDLRFFEALSVD